MIDVAALDRTSAYRLLTTALVPRPVAWVGTRSPPTPERPGIDNLAPFSYFMGVSTDPLRVAFSCARQRDGSRKDTARNLLAVGPSGGACTISIPEQADLATMHATSATWEGSEFQALGIPALPGERVDAPRPATARVTLEGRLDRHIDLGQVDLFLIEVLGVHVDPALLRADGTVDPHAFDPVARLGGEYYAALGERIPLPPARVPRAKE